MTVNNHTETFINYLSNEIYSDLRKNLKSDGYLTNVLNSSSHHISEHLTKSNKSNNLFDLGDIDELNIDDVEKVCQNTIARKTESFVDKISEKIFKKVAKKVYKPKDVNDKKAKEIFKNSLKKSFSDQNIHAALTKTLKSKEYHDLNPNLKSFMLKYNNAKDLSANYDENIKEISELDISDHIKASRIRKFENSISGDIKLEWNKLSSEEKDILFNNYKITKDDINKIAEPVCNQRFNTCIKLQEKVEVALNNLEKSNSENRDKKLANEAKDKLETLISLMKSDTGITYRNQHEESVKQLIDRANDIGIEISDKGDEDLLSALD